MQRKYEENSAMKIEKVEYIPPTPEPESENGKTNTKLNTQF